jgi:hypothetical protein
MAQLPENLWPTTQAVVHAIDSIHAATGLPWWATLSLTAFGEHAHYTPSVSDHTAKRSTCLSGRMATVQVFAQRCCPSQ